MKKIIISVMIILFSGMAFHLKVAADTPIDYYGGYWVELTYGTDPYAAGWRRVVPIYEGVEMLYIHIPFTGYNTLSIEGFNSQFVFRAESVITLTQSFASLGIALDNAEVIYTIDMADYPGIDQLDIDVMQSYDPAAAPPDGVPEAWATSAPIVVWPFQYEIRYYIGGVLDSYEITYTENAPFPVPEVEEGYIFVGWKTIDGTIIYHEENAIIKDEWTETVSGKNLVRLFAVIINLTPITIDHTPPENNAPEWFNGAAAAISMDDEGGYALLFAAAILLITIIFLLLPTRPLPIILYIVATGGVTIAFISWGVMSLLGVLASVIPLVLAILKLVNTGGEGGEMAE